MNARLPMYEGDGFIRPGLATDQVPTTPSASLRESGELRSLEVEARRLRAEYVSGLIKGLMAWARDLPRGATRSRAEHYLSKSTDHADVERRIRTLEREHVQGWNQRIPA